MSDWNEHDYLVFATDGDPEPAYTCFFTPHKCIGHVRAENEVAAAKVIAGLTDRIERFAVIEVTMVDLAPLGHDLVGVVANTPHR